MHTHTQKHIATHTHNHTHTHTETHTHTHTYTETHTHRHTHTETHTHRPSLALSVLQPLSQRVMEPKGLLVSTLMIHTDPHDTHTHTYTQLQY